MSKPYTFSELSETARINARKNYETCRAGWRSLQIDTQYGDLASKGEFTIEDCEPFTENGDIHPDYC